MKTKLYIIIVSFSLTLFLSTANAQIKTLANRAESNTLYQYDRYDKDGNKYESIETQTTELRYECPICKGASVLKNNNSKNGVPVMIACWRCSGKGYLASNSGK